MSDDQPTTDAPAAASQGDPADLGDAGKAAIKAERERANAAERDLKALQTQFEAATAKVTAFEAAGQETAAQIAARDLQITRLNVGIDKGLPKALIGRLQGADEAAIAADADELMKIMPAASAPSTSPRPDPSQGAKTPGSTSLESQFANFMGPLLNH